MPHSLKELNFYELDDIGHRYSKYIVINRDYIEVITHYNSSALEILTGDPNPNTYHDDEVTYTEIPLEFRGKVWECFRINNIPVRWCFNPELKDILCVNERYLIGSNGDKLRWHKIEDLLDYELFLMALLIKMNCEKLITGLHLDYMY